MIKLNSTVEDRLSGRRGTVIGLNLMKYGGNQALVNFGDVMSNWIELKRLKVVDLKKEAAKEKSHEEKLRARIIKHQEKVASKKKAKLALEKKKAAKKVNKKKVSTKKK